MPLRRFKMPQTGHTGITENWGQDVSLGGGSCPPVPAQVTKCSDVSFDVLLFFNLFIPSSVKIPRVKNEVKSKTKS